MGSWTGCFSGRDRDGKERTTGLLSSRCHEYAHRWSFTPHSGRMGFRPDKCDVADRRGKERGLYNKGDFRVLVCTPYLTNYPRLALVPIGLMISMG